MSIIPFLNNKSPQKISFVFVKKDAEMTEQMILAYDVS